MWELCQTQIIDSGECIHYFYRKNVEPKEESPGISLSTPEKSLHPINLELATYKSSVKSLPHGDGYCRTWVFIRVSQHLFLTWGATMFITVYHWFKEPNVYLGLKQTNQSPPSIKIARIFNFGELYQLQSGFKVKEPSQTLFPWTIDGRPWFEFI